MSTLTATHDEANIPRADNSPSSSPALGIFTRIFVPLDGSPRAEQAVGVAARLARAAQGTVILAQVVHLPYEYSLAPFSYPVTYPITQELLDREQLEVAAYLTEIAGLPALYGLSTEKCVLSGVVGPALLDAIETSRATCVVLTTHGRTGVSRWALGSVAEQLARLSGAPTLVLPESADAFGEYPPNQADQFVQPPLRLLVPLDGSALAEAALEPAVHLLSALAATTAAQRPYVTTDSQLAPTSLAALNATVTSGHSAHLAPVGELHLLMALAPSVMTADTAPDTMIREGARVYLERSANRVRERYPEVAVTWSLAATPEAAEGIAEAAGASKEPPEMDYRGYAAVVMASHGRTGFSRWALGSVAERVLQLTRRPLLMVRPLAASTRHVMHETHEAHKAHKAHKAHEALPRTAPETLPLPTAPVTSIKEP